MSLISANNISVKVENVDMKNSHREKPLVVKFDHKLTFDITYQTYVKKLVKAFVPWQE